jgi:hypothetical protein
MNVAKLQPMCDNLDGLASTKPFVPFFLHHPFVWLFNRRGVYLLFLNRTSRLRPPENLSFSRSILIQPAGMA